MWKILKISLAILVTLSLVTCDRITEDTPEEGIDQMIVTGRILDFNNQPRKGIIVNVYYKYYHWDSLFPHSDLRLKASSATDANGCYNLLISRKSDEFNLDREMLKDTDKSGDYTAMVIVVQQDDTRNYYNRSILHTQDINSFWDNRECKMEDLILYDTRTIKIIMNQRHPESDSEGFWVECLFSRHPGGGAIISTIHGPINTSFTLPVGDDLIIKRKWNKEYTDSLMFKYPDIPDVIDASYYP